MFTLGSLVLAGPTFDDSAKLNLNDLHRPSRGGVFTHAIIGPQVRTLTFSFDVPTVPSTGRASLTQVKDFLKANRGLPFSIVDHEGNPKTVILISNEIEFVTSINGQSFTIDLQELPS